MAYEVAGNTLEADANGYLANVDDWSEDAAKVIAEAEGCELNERAWDVVNYLRDEYMNNGGNQPNERNMVKHFKSAWGQSDLSAKDLYTLFPRGPAKQASKIAGLPETKRKGGY